jgi:hypothetical protein
MCFVRSPIARLIFSVEGKTLDCQAADGGNVMLEVESHNILNRTSTLDYFLPFLNEVSSDVRQGICAS